jgi:hypothetical protein
MSWEYIKGSESDFNDAPEWATIKTAFPSDNSIFYFFESREYGAKVSNSSSRYRETVTGPVPFGSEQVVAERRVALKELQQSFDTVQRPAHYNQSDIECIDAIKASMTLAEFQSYLKGNVLKYLWRYRHKNGLEDVKKAQWYINRLAAELQESEKGVEQ